MLVPLVCKLGHQQKMKETLVGAARSSSAVKHLQLLSYVLLLLISGCSEHEKQLHKAQAL